MQDHSWVGKIPGRGNGNPLQHSCPENARDRGAWWATVQESQRFGQDLSTEHSTRAGKRSNRSRVTWSLVPTCYFLILWSGKSRAGLLLEVKTETFLPSPRRMLWPETILSERGGVPFLLPQWVKAFNPSEPVPFRKHQLQGHHLVRDATLALIGYYQSASQRLPGSNRKCLCT